MGFHNPVPSQRRSGRRGGMTENPAPAIRPPRASPTPRTHSPSHTHSDQLKSSPAGEGQRAKLHRNTPGRDGAPIHKSLLRAEIPCTRFLLLPACCCERLIALIAVVVVCASSCAVLSVPRTTPSTRASCCNSAARESTQSKRSPDRGGDAVVIMR